MVLISCLQFLLVVVPGSLAVKRPWDEAPSGVDPGFLRENRDLAAANYGAF
jgi:hypothetical protein